MHILLYNRDAFNQTDLTECLKKSGIIISTFTYIFQDKNIDNLFSSFFTKELKEHHYDAVFSINYYPVIAECCYKTNIKYLSWSYDCPLDVRNIEATIGLPTNYVFLFDKIQAQKYLDLGFNNVYHLPLAVNTNRLDKIKPLSKHYQQYSSDISFVGSLYRSPYTQLLEPLPDYLKGYLDGICESQLLLYGCFFLDDILNDNLINTINNIYHSVYPQRDFNLIKEELSYTMSTQITHIERIRILEFLSVIPNTQISLFSSDKLLNDNIIQKGPVNYMTQMPYVFKTSKINLNITLKCLQSGIPLRALDIMGCNGFLLSNYQPELAEYFSPNVDFIAYGSMEEAIDLATYFLTHEDERKKIALSGYEKVKQKFSYKRQLTQLFEIAKL